MNCPDDRFWDDNDKLTPAGIEWHSIQRAASDARGAEVVELDARAEGYDRDCQAALGDHDWFLHQCRCLDEYGARCCKREGHSGNKHDATLNGYLQFLYSPEKVAALAFTEGPFLRMVPR